MRPILIFVVEKLETFEKRSLASCQNLVVKTSFLIIIMLSSTDTYGERFL